ncbi:hypothetical protein UPYG_G00130990 [Umbra pygmaea]|uniref:ARID domain-containing protein n=1 Tax=Umbra pygmaea TaxID=75934 RepID=A0ABD0WT40_UMBPY
MKTLEEPPYLTVGTDVSAKYRGAFCEAKIKTAKRLVKAKVTFKPELTTAEVHDDSIKGPLKVGAVVEVKNSDGVFQEASINKLTDCSIYTVVFDDGDEKTLRRSSLCLKGARHFAESETLDRLPLTNPEHFGTPVIGNKGNRGRRSNPVQEEVSSSSSSEEDEGDGTQDEELFGKVVCVEASASPGDKKNKSTTWYPALVITSHCHEEATMKKDTIFVRSFKDGKFNTVLRKEVRLIDLDCPPKADVGLKPALDAALQFVRQAAVPSSWRTEVKAESSSSEEDDDAEEEEEPEEGPSGEEDEEEVEPYPEERENFLQQLYKFMEDRGTPINKKPVLGYRSLDLFKLYRLVHKLGGFHDIESGTVWKTVYQALGIPVLNSAAGYNVKCAYRKYLYGFEEYCTSCAITFRMDLPFKLPKAEGEESGSATSTLLAGSSSSADGEKQKALFEKPSATEEISCTQLISMKPEETTESDRNKIEGEALKAEQKHDDVDDHEKHGSDDEDCPSFARLRVEGVKLEPDEEDEEGKETGDISGDESCSQEGDGDDDDDDDLGEEGEEFECYPPGMKVQVRYGRGRSLKTYTATVREADVEGGKVLYLVHYCGWNVRYDEWVKADKIVRPANKNVQKIKHRKKIKNKVERERDRLARLNEDLGSPSLNSLLVPRSSSKPSCPGMVLNRHDVCEPDNASETSTDDSDHEGEEGECDDEDQGPTSGGPPSGPQTSDQWKATSSAHVPKTPLVAAKSQEPKGVETLEEGKRRSQQEFPAEREGPGLGSSTSRKRRCEAAPPKGPPLKTKPPPRTTRTSDWLPGSSRRKEDGGDSCSSSDDDEVDEAVTEPNGDQSDSRDRERPSPRPNPSPSKKYNGMKHRTLKAGGAGVVGTRPAGFWEIPEKRAKMAAGLTEDRVASGARTKGQKDVWSSIQAQWPKQTLKELFSDSDTEAATSPTPGPTNCSSSGPEERDSSGEREEEELRGVEKKEQEEEEQLEEKRSDELEEDKRSEQEEEEEKRSAELEEFPSSSSNSGLNTPTTPESPSGALEPQPSSPPPSAPPGHGDTSFTDPLTRVAPDQHTPRVEEASGGRSETDSSSVEVESLGGELLEHHLPPDQEQTDHDPHGEGASSCQTKAFLPDAGLGNLSSSHSQSNSTCSLELSTSSQHDSTEHKAKVSANQKRQRELQAGGAAKNIKPNRKSSVPPKKNRKTAHSSDSEDLFVGESGAKSPVSKTHSATDLKGGVSPKCPSQGPGRTPPSSQKYHKPQHSDPDHHRLHHHHHPHHREHHSRTPRVYKWSFQMSELEKMSSLERIAFLQDKLHDIRNHYLSLKSEVASIDRRRKRIKKKERESTVAASSSSSSSSSPSSSSLTAAVMLTLADPPVSSSSQNSGVSVECR